MAEAPTQLLSLKVMRVSVRGLAQSPTSFSVHSNLLSETCTGYGMGTVLFKLIFLLCTFNRVRNVAAGEEPYAWSPQDPS